MVKGPPPGPSEGGEVLSDRVVTGVFSVWKESEVLYNFVQSR
jgi:hypothetical protein